MNSREKGKRGERQWRDELRANGYDARRGQQFNGSPDSPDVICDALPDFHFEVKCVERLNLHAAMRQAGRDGARKTPVVAHKRNYGPWLTTIPLEALSRFLCNIEIIFADPDWLHVLLKRTQRLDLISACALAEAHCGGKPWMIVHQRPGWPAMVTMSSGVFFQFLRGDLPVQGNAVGAHGVRRPATRLSAAACAAATSDNNNKTQNNNETESQ